MNTDNFSCAGVSFLTNENVTMSQEAAQLPGSGFSRRTNGQTLCVPPALWSTQSTVTVVKYSLAYSGSEIGAITASPFSQRTRTQKKTQNIIVERLPKLKNGQSFYCHWLHFWIFFLCLCNCHNSDNTMSWMEKRLNSPSCFSIQIFPDLLDLYRVQFDNLFFHLLYQLPSSWRQPAEAWSYGCIHAPAWHQIWLFSEAESWGTACPWTGSRQHLEKKIKNEKPGCTKLLSSASAKSQNQVKR